MKKLKNKIIIMSVLILLSACQTTRDFEIKNDAQEELNIIKVTKNRIIYECYFVNAELENKWRHQYFMYILNDKNVVLTVMYPTNQDKSSCQKHMKKVEKILREENQVTFCIRGNLKPADYDKDLYDFGALGKHKSVYDPLTFDTICNSKKCYSLSDTWTTTCPGIKEGKSIEKFD